MGLLGANNPEEPTWLSSAWSGGDPQERTSNPQYIQRNMYMWHIRSTPTSSLKETMSSDQMAHQRSSSSADLQNGSLHLIVNEWEPDKRRMVLTWTIAPKDGHFSESLSWDGCSALSYVVKSQLTRQVTLFSTFLKRVSWVEDQEENSLLPWKTQDHITTWNEHSPSKFSYLYLSLWVWGLNFRDNKWAILVQLLVPPEMKDTKSHEQLGWGNWLASWHSKA